MNDIYKKLTPQQLRSLDNFCKNCGGGLKLKGPHRPTGKMNPVMLSAGLSSYNNDDMTVIKNKYQGHRDRTGLKKYE